MKRTGSFILHAIAISLLLAGSAFAEDAPLPGDKAQGEKEFKKCTACHSLEEGKRKVGPSLFGIIDRQAAQMEGFKYSSDLEEAAKKGLVWTPSNLVEYLEDPKKYLAKFLEKGSARSKMLNKFKKLETRQNIAAYLSSLKKPTE